MFRHPDTAQRQSLKITPLGATMSQKRAAKQQRHRQTIQGNRHQRRAVEAVARSVSRPAVREPLPLEEALAVKRPVLEAVDKFSDLRNNLRRLAGKVNEWAGIPMPLDGQPLVIESSYPFAKILDGSVTTEQIEADNKKEEEDQKVRNSWWSHRHRGHVYIWEEEGKIKHGVLPAGLANDILINTIGASYAWGVEQEARAVQTLGTLVRHHTFKQYLMTGSFLERSKRSGIMYVFRRLRPTVAISTTRSGKRRFPPFSEESTRVLCTLCLHPIGYYRNSWAGAMCPTDEVIAHLMLMRGDEHLFWRRANQHPSWVPQSGLGA
jgi:hypothetical protein